MPTTETKRGGPVAGALPLIFVLVLTACSADAGTSSTSTTTTTLAPSTTSTTVATTSTIAAATSTVPVDPVTTVNDALAASGHNYRFASVVLVGEDTLTSISGIVDGNSVSAEVAAGGSELSYVRTPEGEWVTGPDGEWVVLEGEPPVAAPLGSMADVGQLALESGDAESGVFTGVLGPAAGPAQGLPFSLTIQGGLVTEVRYQVDTGGEIAQVITTLSDVGAAGSVSRPEGV
jgi:hypothetical protein